MSYQIRVFAQYEKQEIENKALQSGLQQLDVAEEQLHKRMGKRLSEMADKVIDDNPKRWDDNNPEAFKNDLIKWGIYGVSSIDPEHIKKNVVHLESLHKKSDSDELLRYEYWYNNYTFIIELVEEKKIIT